MYDMKQLDKLKKMPQLVPEAYASYRQFSKQVMQEGAISVKNKAKHAGVTEQEIAETIMIASLLRMGAAITHGAHCLD